MLRSQSELCALFLPPLPPLLLPRALGMFVFSAALHIIIKIAHLTIPFSDSHNGKPSDFVACSEHHEAKTEENLCKKEVPSCDDDTPEQEVFQNLVL